jgi:hypothetical protein
MGAVHWEYNIKPLVEIILLQYHIFKKRLRNGKLISPLGI